MSTKSTLKMQLSLDGDKTMTLSLLDPKSGLTRAEVTTCLQEIIDKQALVQNGAFPVAVKEIYIENVENVALV